MGEQVPSEPTRLQERQAPPHAVLQQTPSAQWPEAHSTSPPGQSAPFIFLPQLPCTHLRPLTQSASVLHVGKQRFVPALHENGAQTVEGPALQAPAPSQAKVSVTASPEHLPALQMVPASYERHFPAPSQVPSRPQVDASCVGHWVAIRGFTPDGVNVQVPSAVGRPQDMQLSPQALSQQKPSAQKPVEHWALQVHACPLDLFRDPSSFGHGPSEDIILSVMAASPGLGFGVEDLHPVTAPTTSSKAAAAIQRAVSLVLPIIEFKISGNINALADSGTAQSTVRAGAHGTVRARQVGNAYTCARQVPRVRRAPAALRRTRER